MLSLYTLMEVILMENDVLNVPQPDGKKATVRKVLLIVWLALCTALFIYFLYRTISLLIDYIDLYNYYYENYPTSNLTSSFNKAIKQHSVALVAGIFLFASVCVLLIPKIIAIFRSSALSLTAKRTSLEKKILLAVWILLCAAALVYLFVYTISEINTAAAAVSENTEVYKRYEALLAEGDDMYRDNYIEMVETATDMIQYYKKIMVKWIFTLFFALSCTPIAVLFIPKVRTVFKRYKKEDVFPDF